MEKNSLSKKESKKYRACYVTMQSMQKEIEGGCERKVKSHQC